MINSIEKQLKATKTTPITAAIAFLALTTLSSQATLLVHEGFAPAGTNVNIVGTASGTGFTDVWTDSLGSGGITRTADNMGMGAYPGNVYFPSPSGGKASGNATWDYKSVIRTMTTPVDFNTDGQYYMSFLLNDEQTSPNYDLRLFLGNATTRIHVGHGYGTAVIALTDPSAASLQYPWDHNVGWLPAGPWPILRGDPLQFVVVEILTSSGGPATIHVKFYTYDPIAGTGDQVDPDPASVAWTSTYSGYITGTFEQLGIGSTGGGGTMEVDEIRLGTVWEDVVNLTPPASLTILGQPQSQTVAPGGTATLTVATAGGIGTPTYRWQKEVSGTFVNLSNGGNLWGATSTTLAITNIQPANAGSYRAVITAGASTNSNPAAITVLDAAAVAIATHAAITITNGAVGFHYQVQYSDDLGATWQLLQNIPSLSANPYRVYDPTPATLPRRFYQAVVLP